MLPAFDWKNPDYVPVWAERARRLEVIRDDIRQRGTLLRDLKAYYHDQPADFINDWAVTVDVRVAAKRSPVMPLLLFPKQRELIEWLLTKWRAGDPGIMEKSRDVGASWVAMALSCTLCLFYDDISIGVGSYVEDKIDRSGDPDSLFYKIRMFLNYLPAEFRGGWDLKKHSAHMRVQFPGTGSSITGEAGDNIGRGGRKTIYFVDESAHLERPQLVDASLSANTDCRIDMSSVNGGANPFAEKRHGGAIDVFTFGWRDDPRKDDAWYAKKSAELDPVVLAQEIDLNYNASVEGVIIPSAWVEAAIDAHLKLGIVVSGGKFSGFDVADGGGDKNAWVARHGILLTHAEQWSGKESDIYVSTQKVFRYCDEHDYSSFSYDADGLGAGVKGDARTINEARAKLKHKRIRVAEHRGSAAVVFPEQKVKGADGKLLDRKNIDYYYNYKAQCWFALRYRFQQTYRALQGMPYDKDDLISIDSKLPMLTRLKMELSQAVFKQNLAGKMLVDKQPEGTISPNLGDGAVICYAPRRMAITISDSLLENA